MYKKFLLIGSGNFVNELKKMQEYSENYASSGDENIFVERGNMLVHFEQELEKLERDNIL